MAGPLPFNALNAFVVAARLGSFSKASDELNVTPAAISQQIRVLEDLLGVQLFHRLKRGLVLTDSGAAGLKQLQSGFDNIQQAVQKIQSSDHTTVLNIWTSPSFATKWLMPRMHSFREKYPSIDLRISGSAAFIDSDSSAPTLSAELLRAHNIDVAIRFGRGNYPGCDVELLMDVDAIPLCSPALLEQSACVPLDKPSDLLLHTLLHDESPYEGRPTWNSWFDAAGLSGQTGAHNLYFNSVLLALTAAIEGQGVVLTLEQLAQDDINKGRLLRLFNLQVEVERAFHVVSLKGAEADARVVAFREWLFEQVSAQPDNAG